MIPNKVVYHAIETLLLFTSAHASLSQQLNLLLLHAVWRMLLKRLVEIKVEWKL
jgi:hypothetical protein